ncbi:hypothetical protein [Streptomyces sp. NPDC059122]|uniref:hypothetical protein n=1 Tax=unclassified Streptomyces TaxID=2593676 RepID=UPI00368F55DC
MLVEELRAESGDSACWLDPPRNGLCGWDTTVMVNRLVHAQSPYLQQHATNPVD